MRFALGTIAFGTAVGERDTFAILDRFAEAGGTMLDTADNYPFWVEGCTGDESELVIGAWLAARGNRDRIFLSTKVGARPTVPGDMTLDSMEGLSAAVIGKAVEGSLHRLRTDYIDVYWSHVEDRAVPLEETLGAFNELAEAGKIRNAGASNMRTWRLERARNVAAANGWLPYTYLQLRHTYLRPRPGVRQGGGRARRDGEPGGAGLADGRRAGPDRRGQLDGAARRGHRRRGGAARRLAADQVGQRVLRWFRARRKNRAQPYGRLHWAEGGLWLVEDHERGQGGRPTR